MICFTAFTLIVYQIEARQVVLVEPASSLFRTHKDQTGSLQVCKDT
ncbi:hypothetical protein LINPERHAP2_LOCUS6625, partial [Linum perenne]